MSRLRFSSREERCPGCSVEPNSYHRSGCPIARCQRCGMQAIGCDCIYIVCGMDPATLEQDHPLIYRHGPSKEMYRTWDRLWGRKEMRWIGEWPGYAECREYGFWCVGPPWRPVPADTFGSVPDLNRLVTECLWDPEQQKFVRAGPDGKPLDRPSPTINRRTLDL